MLFESHNQSDLASEDRPLVTVFCAVWHKQVGKLELLRSHWENLKAQSIRVEPCYIFDNGEEAPEWLDAPWHSFSEPLTIYEAWAAAVALAKTRYVMNLNMDDRLATNGAQELLNTAMTTSSALVGGDWLVCFDKQHLSLEFPVTDLEGTQYLPAWPPRRHQGLRLGSGSGERGTLGAATMWDLDIVGKWYPTYFGNGAPILSIGDTIFWGLLKHKNLKLTRLPKIIGRYYSDPDAQAEFRPHQDNDLLKSEGLSTRSFADGVRSGDFCWHGKAAARVRQKPLNKIEKKSAELEARYRRLFGLPAQQVAAE
ncbi:glycosyltransferase family 2 protein [Leisingera daeponensis]|uniref:Glycosyltransferase family 2 protein n=1 Tax=Leisingera daeponensis TaxID=405746 RepID=A0ABS7NJT6_9RHOB|nr:glycosyltransferase family 2 protein [Leisingera daeponensis]MBY6140964.1 glycosyltransferase family 2 protein [Leisingera daeponensis]